MELSDIAQGLTLLLLLALSAWFSSSETALTTVNRIRIRTLSESGEEPRAAILLLVLDDQSRMLSAILIGNNIVNLSASSLMTTLTMRLFGSRAVGLATGILTLLVLVFGEITPKTMATISAEKVSLNCAKTIYMLMNLLTPVIAIINALSRGVLLLLGVDPSAKAEAITEDELRTIVEVSHEEGVIESEEKQMINNVFDFGDAQAKDVMIPRVDMTFIDVDASYEELLEIFRQEKYTRIPVYEGTIDNVIGIMNIKDLLLIDHHHYFHLRDYMREPLFTYEFKKISDLMLEMRKSFHNLAIVVDEYGATAGLVTLEDMLEEIVGEIRDEYDADEESSLVELEPGEYSVSGSMKLDDLNDQLGLHLSSEDYDSVGGYVIGLLGDLPEEGDTAVDGGMAFRVEQVDKNRIDRIRLSMVPIQEENS